MHDPDWHDPARGVDQIMDRAVELPQHYIETDTALVQRSLRSLKYGDMFAVFDDYGDIGGGKSGPEGLYFNDTRFLSKYELQLEGQRPLLLSSVVQDDNAALSVDLANADVHVDGVITLPRDTIALERTKFLWQAVCYERIGFCNYADSHRRFRIDIVFNADFRDLFEVRGSQREKRGIVKALVTKTGAEFHYVGLDGVTRTTELRFTPTPVKLEANRAMFEFDLAPNQRGSLFVSVLCQDRNQPKCIAFQMAFRDRRRDIRAKTSEIATVASSNDVFNEICRRSTSDLYMLITRTPYGLYPYAGIPWYSTPFGRDGIITAMLLLWLDPSVAKGVLSFLAATQAKTVDAAADAEPGKILHETRNGEMARLGEVPFRLYYGTVDATPLFVMLAGMYFERTGDQATLTAIWPNVKAALDWIDIFGDMDGDGFVEYARRTGSGLANQGWKDSHDSIFHADGALAEGPIAMCEVQGYVFSAKVYAAGLASQFGDLELAKKLLAEAHSLQRRFEAAFWCEDLGVYALALDGRKKPCRVRTSNAGHALFTGIASPRRAARVAQTLLSADSFSGWGVRTVARGEARYNPISYHNGSIWPHDNAIIALGFARYGLAQEANRLFTAMFEAARHQELRRLPELFCGFIRRPHRGPTAYPVACAPQAWAAATPFAFLAACLNMELRDETNAVRFNDPVMPDFLDYVEIRRLSLRQSRFDLRFQRHGEDVTLNLLSRRGDAKVMLLK
ncbi:amylo-alpha-1,6-glucosidase [Methylocapsa palsarum]|uniref:Glycogen debranching enzyme (Alpha-1,6-glucosidase) n=1 Tax=Methylocapsa palsarum TaxID=1612308 RepID=A0A1I3Z5C1_9HYPH|nr:Glycogen debranching enzyme (alpha-1,6-glucosidase) [Methylocapsa palsarum]